MGEGGWIGGVVVFVGWVCERGRGVGGDSMGCF